MVGKAILTVTRRTAELTSWGEGGRRLAVLKNACAMGQDQTLKKPGSRVEDGE